MKIYSITNEKYLSIVRRLINEKNEILITIKHPYQAGNKDLFLINSITSFNNIIRKSKPRELIVIDNSIKKVTQGIVTKDFIKKTIDKIKIQEKENLIVIFPEFNGDSKYWNDYFEDKKDLEEYLKLNTGHYAYVFKESNELDLHQTIYAIVPDSDGKIRSGAY